jgi:hypothetical protein
MKPFNLEDAKKGCPICTRDGHKARIICYDCKDKKYPIIALIDENDYEYPVHYTIKGEYSSSSGDNKADLMMAPVKHEKWINIYRSEKGIYAGNTIYDTKEQAIEAGIAGRGYVSTSKIEWEEK